jgi:hypothetical protein
MASKWLRSLDYVMIIFHSSGVMVKESKSKTYSLEMNYSGIREVNTNLVLTFRNKKYEGLLKTKGFLDNETILNSISHKI